MAVRATVNGYEYRTTIANTHRKEHVRAIEEAKKPETRARRIEKALEILRAPHASSRR